MLMRQRMRERTSVVTRTGCIPAIVSAEYDETTKDKNAAVFQDQKKELFSAESEKN